MEPNKNKEPDIKTDKGEVQKKSRYSKVKAVLKAEETFGLLKDRKEDLLLYLKELRSE